ncbi:MAG: histidine phosphatase family protein [Pelolinea sp.]|nr:histidine phosphatase family protein [Pelolinea sp.]
MDTSTKVVLVRHAQTEMITKKLIHGHSDSPLSQKGIRDAKKTADHFRGQPFDAFYSSSIGRAMRTAEIIGNAINMTPVPTDGFKERYYGWLEGKSTSLFEPDLSGPKIMRPFIRFALNISGESPEYLIDRVIKTFDGITTKHKGQRILMVIHWGILSVLTQYLQGKDLTGCCEIGPWISCGISEFHQKENSWQPIYMDKGDHLI